MTETRVTVRRILIGLLSIAIVLIVVRFVLVVLGASAAQPLVVFFFSITDFLVSPFGQVVAPDRYFILLSSVAIECLVALGFWTVAGLIIIELITSFIDDDPINILVGIVDTFLKVLQFILMTRFIFKLLGANVVPGNIVDSVYNSTNWVQGILPTFNILGAQVETSTIIAFLIVLVADITLENIVESVREDLKKEDKVVVSSPSPAGSPVVVSPVVQQSPSEPQRITINITQPDKF